LAYIKLTGKDAGTYELPFGTFLGAPTSASLSKAGFQPAKPSAARPRRAKPAHVDSASLLKAGFQPAKSSASSTLEFGHFDAVVV